MSVERFYDELAPFYHLIFPDWEASIRRQAEALDGVIRERWGDSRLSILDVACGIGTQALGLAARRHRVTASDISAAEVERADGRPGTGGWRSASRSRTCVRRRPTTGSSSTW